MDDFTLVTGDNKGTIHVFSLCQQRATLKQISEITTDNQTKIQTLSLLSPNILVSSEINGSIKIWEFRKKILLRLF